MEIKSLKDLDANEQTSFYAVLKKFKFRQGEGQNHWKSIQAVFGDKTGDINSSPVYGTDPLYTILEKIPEGTHVKIQGSVNEYQGEPQIKIGTIRIASSQDEDYNPKNLLKVTSLDTEDMFNYLVGTTRSISSDEVRNLTLKLLDDYGDEFKTAPASVEIHHPYIGGLLEHVWRMLKIEESIENLYPFIDRDVVISGIILHDLGKIREYSVKKGGVPAVTDAGELFGHIYMGASIIQNEALRGDGFEPSSKIKNLLHIVLSHHGKREYGSPQPPKTPEAWLVHLIDFFESRMQIIKEQIDDIKPGKWSQSKIWPLENARLVNLKDNDG
ncbi:HD domain-containing protein [candidate division WOR-3 bacterium]|nr:HD domain-containing protein [candidate division WOR-3 bacterium]